VQRFGWRKPPAQRAHAGQRGPDRPQCADPSRLHTAPLQSDRRGARRASDLRLHARTASDAGPNNHWMSPRRRAREDGRLFAGCMRGRTLYVVPYCMGPIDSPLSRCGVEITDSAYVVANMRIMTRMGAALPWTRIERASTPRVAWHTVLRQRPALHRRARSGASLHHAFPRGTQRSSPWLGLWRQRPARQEMPCAAHRPAIRRAAKAGWPSTC
jgi:hypothetical protein